MNGKMLNVNLIKYSVFCCWMKATKFKLHIPSLFTRSFTFVFFLYFTLHWCFCLLMTSRWIHVNENARVYISRVKLFGECVKKPLERSWSCMCICICICIHRYHFHSYLLHFQKHFLTRVKNFIYLFDTIFFSLLLF